MQKNNPIVFADYPDLDIIRVDNTYYMCTTTMHVFPGGEILRSFDLINWEHCAYVYDVLGEQKKKGVGILFIGEDLDVLLELCDRIMVICGGRISGIVDGRTTTKEEVGLLMTKVEYATAEAEEKEDEANG